jgi:predicted RNase H-like nuclease (RuvC/YqgF family)
MMLLQKLDQSNHEEHEQKFQLENKEEEIKSLKTKVINLTEEMEELKKHDSKRKEVLKESGKCYVNIYPIDELEEELSKAKQKVDWSIYVYHFDHNDSDYSFLHDHTK